MSWELMPLPEAIAYRNTGEFHSEASRQELIGKQAKLIVRDLNDDVLVHETVSIEVGESFIGFIESETVGLLVRLVERGDADNVMRLLGMEIDKAIERVADDRAERCIEDMSPG
jgi:hypothetical protein